jgi:hypothetical protein
MSEQFLTYLAKRERLNDPKRVKAVTAAAKHRVDEAREHLQRASIVSGMIASTYCPDRAGIDRESVVLIAKAAREVTERARDFLVDAEADLERIRKEMQVPDYARAS